MFFFPDKDSHHTHCSNGDGWVTAKQYFLKPYIMRDNNIQSTYKFY